MSKRVPIIVIGIIVLLVLITPYGLGSLAESNVRSEIDTMASNPTVALEVIDYERGWFKSRAIIEVSPGEMYTSGAAVQDPMMQMIMSQLRAPFVVELGHGPILTMNGIGIGSYDVRATLDSSTEWVQMAMTTLGIPYVIELRGRTGFGSGFNYEGDIPVFEADEQGQTLTFSGLTFAGNVSRSALEFQAHSDRLALQSMFMSFSLEGLDIETATERRPDSISLGEGAISIDRFVAVNPLLGAEEVIALEGLKASGYTRLNDRNNIDYGALYESTSVRAQNVPNFSDIALGLNLTNLDAEAFGEIYELVSDSSTLADPTMLAFQMLPILDAMLASGPGMSVNPMRFSMDSGQLDGQINISIDPSVLPTGQIMDLADSNVLMAALKADVKLTASKALTHELVAMTLEGQMGPQLVTMTEDEIDSFVAQQVDQTLAMTAAQGMITDDGQNYSTTILFENGIATVNGVEIPIGALGLF